MDTFIEFAKKKPYLWNVYAYVYVAFSITLAGKSLMIFGGLYL